MGKPKGGKKRKTELVFDQQKRREFLTGFRKRKQERRKKAKDELEKQVKEDRKRIKQELRDGFQDQFKKSFEPIELEAHLREEEYDAENVTVQIVELDPEEISKSNNWIGANKPVYDGDENSDVGENDSGVDDNDDNEEDDVPGFTVTSTKVRRKPATHNENSVANANGGDDHEADQVEKKAKKLREDFKSKRAMGQYMAKQAQNTLKHSKAYQMKNKLERIRNKKKARIEKEKRIKLQNKREKHKKNSAKPSKPSKFSKKGKTQRK